MSEHDVQIPTKYLAVLPQEVNVFLQYLMHSLK